MAFGLDQAEAEPCIAFLQPTGRPLFLGSGFPSGPNSVADLKAVYPTLGALGRGALALMFATLGDRLGVTGAVSFVSLGKECRGGLPRCFR
jgi:hypothetical protein